MGEVLTEDVSLQNLEPLFVRPLSYKELVRQAGHFAVRKCSPIGDRIAPALNFVTDLKNQRCENERIYGERLMSCPKAILRLWNKGLDHAHWMILRDVNPRKRSTKLSFAITEKLELKWVGKEVGVAVFDNVLERTSIGIL